MPVRKLLNGTVIHEYVCKTHRTSRFLRCLHVAITIRGQAGSSNRKSSAYEYYSYEILSRKLIYRVSRQLLIFIKFGMGVFRRDRIDIYLSV
jgi:hypothetical protein